MGIPNQFNDIIQKHLNVFASWIPIVNKFSLGDYGIFSDGVFSRYAFPASVIVFSSNKRDRKTGCDIACSRPVVLHECDNGKLIAAAAKAESCIKLLLII